jgi:hypothetical protein
MKRKMVDVNETIGEIGRLRGATTSRRQFCGLGLVLPTFGLPGPKNVRRKHVDTVLYRGPMRLAEDVVRLAQQSGVVKTTHRKLAVRISHGGIAYVLRVVGGRDYLGEIVRTERGEYRVHVWSIVDGPMPDVSAIIERKTANPPAAEASIRKDDDR